MTYELQEFFKQLAFVFFIVGIIFFPIVVIATLNLGLPNEGTHTGYITAVEKSGIFFKTYTVYVKSDTQSSQEDEYCLLDNESLLSEVNKARETKKLVNVSFQRGFILPFWECNGENSKVISIK